MKKILTKFKGLMFLVRGLSNLQDATSIYKDLLTSLVLQRCINDIANTITWDAYLLRTGVTVF